MKILTKPELAKLEKALAILTEISATLTCKCEEIRTKNPQGALAREKQRYDLQDTQYAEEKAYTAKGAIKNIIAQHKALSQ